MEFNYSKAFFVMLQGKTYKNTIWHHLLLIRNLSYLTIYYQELAHLVFKPHSKRERYFASEARGKGTFKQKSWLLQ